MLRNREPWYAWDTVDWSKSNSVIAAELGCSRQAVYNKRRKLGLAGAEPPRVDWGAHPELATEHCSVLAPRLGLTEAAVRRAQQRRGYSTARKKDTDKCTK